MVIDFAVKCENLNELIGYATKIFYVLDFSLAQCLNSNHKL